MLLATGHGGRKMTAHLLALLDLGPEVRGRWKICRRMVPARRIMINALIPERFHSAIP